MNEFTFYLLNIIAKQHDSKNENLIFSPLGVNAALAMIYMGSLNKTRAQMSQVLGAGPTTEQGLKDYAQLWKATLLRLLSGENTTDIEIANSLWIKNSFTLNSDFVECVKFYFNSETFFLDFKIPTSFEKMNDWVAIETHSKINEIIKSPLSADSQFILLNAIYFKAQWETKFEISQTLDAPFYNLDASQKLTPLMQTYGEFNFFEDHSVQVLELPYRENNFSMIIILPEKMARDKATFDQITEARFNSYIRGMNRQTGFVKLPRFKIESEKFLKAILVEMGITNAFNENAADFGAITNSDRLKIDEIIHKSFFEINEEGAEAAAATAIDVFKSTSIAVPQEPFLFLADHPFLFAIRNQQTGHILFLGSITKLGI